MTILVAASPQVAPEAAAGILSDGSFARYFSIPPFRAVEREPARRRGGAGDGLSAADSVVDGRRGTCPVFETVFATHDESNELSGSIGSILQPDAPAFELTVRHQEQPGLGLSSTSVIGTFHRSIV